MHAACSGGGDAVPRVWARAAAHADHRGGGPGVGHPRRGVGCGARLPPCHRPISLKTLCTCHTLCAPFPADGSSGCSSISLVLWWHVVRCMPKHTRRGLNAALRRCLIWRSWRAVYDCSMAREL